VQTAWRLFPVLVLVLACQQAPSARSSANKQGAHNSNARASTDSLAAGPDSLNHVLCQGLNNSYLCAQTIEKHLLAEGKHGVLRRDAELHIPLLTGDTLVLRDSVSDTATGVRHSYRAYLPSIGYHVVEVQYYEGGTYLLVNGVSGKTAFSNGVPVVSPDNRRLAAANVDLESGYSPTTVQVWRLEDDSLALEWEHDFLAGGAAADSTWGPSALRWLTPNEIRLAKQYALGEVRGESFVRLGSAGWDFSPP
jgi:hypothetical protein